MIKYPNWQIANSGADSDSDFSESQLQRPTVGAGPILGRILRGKALGDTEDCIDDSYNKLRFKHLAATQTVHKMILQN